ncbi:hypothetical protein [Vibrio alginolyticus]|uniref:hypothetical protein n=1 Tax=Vibrio alginolyticus TaxID=663 RepID=UPI0021CE1879|nr:hypothetical protein [Vibrio alginolyticus]ELB1661605.1 hypothetical protein [Vibrio alginolyticus]
MAIVIKLANANFSGKGFANIFPFVAPSDLAFGFDFKPGTDQLKDVAGKVNLNPWFFDDTAEGAAFPGSNNLKDTDDKLGLRLALASLIADKSYVPTEIPLDGTRRFTMLSIAKDNGIVPTDGSTSIASFIDYATNATSTGMEQCQYSQNLSFRVNDGSSTFADSAKSKPITFMVTTFDGSVWRHRNITLGSDHSKTNAEAGIAGSVKVGSRIDWGEIESRPFLAIGGTTDSSRWQSKRGVDIYQAAMWNRVLSDEEILQQYEMSKTSLPGLPI